MSACETERESARESERNFDGKFAKTFSRSKPSPDQEREDMATIDIESIIPMPCVCHEG